MQLYVIIFKDKIIKYMSNTKDILKKCEENLPIELLRYICEFHHKKCNKCNKNYTYEQLHPCEFKFWFNSSPGIALPLVALGFR